MGQCDDATRGAPPRPSTKLDVVHGGLRILQRGQRLQRDPVHHRDVAAAAAARELTHRTVCESANFQNARLKPGRGRGLKPVGRPFQARRGESTAFSTAFSTCAYKGRAPAATLPNFPPTAMWCPPAACDQGRLFAYFLSLFTQLFHLFPHQ
jgi:hypothetical protein